MDLTLSRFGQRTWAPAGAALLALALAGCGSQPPKPHAQPTVSGPIEPMKTLEVYYNNGLLLRGLGTYGMQPFRRRHAEAVRLLEAGLKARGVKAYVHTSEIEGTPQEAARHGARVGADHLLVLYMTRATVQGRHGGPTSAVWRLDVHALNHGTGSTTPVYSEQFDAEETCTPWNKEGECEAFIPNYVLGVLEKRGFIEARKASE